MSAPLWLRAVIIEDEDLARDRLRRLLARAGGVDIVGEAADGRQGLELIEATQPDVVLLDISMPELDGLRLLEALDDPPAIIYTTAYEHHAVRAFELEAADYLLKPFSGERLARALDRVRRQFTIRSTAPLATVPPIAAEDGKRTILVPPANLVLARIVERVVLLRRDDGETLCYTGTLQELEEILPEGDFLRASRQCIVNRHAITAYSPTPEGGLRLDLRTGEAETVSRRRARFFRHGLRWGGHDPSR